MPVLREVVTSRSNARVKQLRAAFAGHARLSGGLVAIEGEHLLEEAIRSGMAIKSVFLTEDRPAPAYLPASIEILRLTEEVFSSVVETRSPQGVAALIVPPVWTFDHLLWGIPLLVVAVGLQDPGNLGTLLRSAEAFGASGLVTTSGTVSVWNGKAVRASVGSVFRVPAVEANLDDLLRWRSGGIRILAAVGPAQNSSAVLDIAATDLTTGVAILIGNEGAGLGPEWTSIADEHVTIPCSGPVESLNAAIAGSLLLYEAQRQRLRVGARP